MSELHTFDIGSEEVISHDMYRLSEHFFQTRKTFPIFFKETVFDRDDGVF
jgi:hypothetical protein